MWAVSERETSRGVWRGSSLASSSGRVNLLLFVLSLAVISTIVTSEPSLIQPHHLQKRALIQFCSLINIFSSTDCSDYNNYGCYCGQDNKSGNPVDAVDRCCQVHDRCYDASSCFLSPLIATYKYTCTGRSCNCTDSLAINPCDYKVCQCDLAFAQCLQSTTYNPRYKGSCPR